MPTSLSFSLYLRAITLSIGALLSTGPAFAGLPTAAPKSIPSAPSSIAPYQPRFGRPRPVVAVVGQNVGTELADFVVPYGILTASNAADVLALSVGEGPMRFRPALRIEPGATIAQFDQRYPEGADYLVVPAAGNPEDPVLLDWIRAQARKGATIISICDGALVVAKAGIFKGHRATGHWATQTIRERGFPDTTWLKDTRYVADDQRVSSAGVTAAIPLSLALVEAFAGRARALEVAQELGVDNWSPRHDSSRFHMGFGMYFTGYRNMLFASHQALGLPVETGVDDIALALVADAYGRTHRNQVFTVATSTEGIRTRHGLTLLPDRTTGEVSRLHHLLPPLGTTHPLQALDAALADIAARYGRSTSRLVALQLEYPEGLR